MSQTCTKFRGHTDECGLGPSFLSIQVIHTRAVHGQELQMCGRWIGKYGDPFHRAGMDAHDGLTEECPQCTTHGTQPCGCVWWVGKMKSLCTQHMRMGLAAGLVLKDGELISTEEL